ncbi:hypothetical protein ACFLTI_10685 [Bacteroidota bacterium]
MRIKSFSIFIISILASVNLNGQNLDLHSKYFSGKYFSMAGTGAGLAGGINTFDINPGSLGFIKKRSYSVSYNINLYSYYLSRENADMYGVYEYDWNKIQHNFDNVLAVFPGKNKFSFGGGIIRKLSPYVQNESRALTMSKLFEQETSGGVYAIILSSSYRMSEKLSVGISMYGYDGIIRSEIKGDLHGADLDKWALLENKLSGLNFRLGLLYKSENFSSGLVIESPYKMKLKNGTSLSDDKKYEYLFPGSVKQKWNMPTIIRLGISYFGLKNCLISFDIESRMYISSEINLNVWEYGEKPNWKNIGIIRTGFEVYPFKNKTIPFRAGYALIPQLYASNISYGQGYFIEEYENTDQIKKQLFSIGFSFPVNKIILNIGLAYNIYTWEREIQAVALVNENFREKNFLLNVSILHTIE